MGKAVEALRLILGRDKSAHLVALWPNGQLESASFGPKDDSKLQAWLDEYNGRASLYFHPNELYGAPPSGRAKKKDVARGLFGFIDIDVPPAAVKPDLWKSQTVDELKSCDHPPSFIIDSGYGVHAYWKLDPALDMDEDGAGERLEKVNQALRDTFGGDKGTWSRDRLFRIPFTVNVPDKRKASKGREPCDSSLLEATGYSYAIEALESRFCLPEGAVRSRGNGVSGGNGVNGNGVSGGNGVGGNGINGNGHGSEAEQIDAAVIWSKLPRYVRNRIENPLLKDRSAEVHWASTRMFEIGYSVIEAYAVLSVHSESAVAKYGPRLHNEVERCWWKWQQKGGKVDQGPDFGAGNHKVQFDFRDQVSRWNDIGRTAEEINDLIAERGWRRHMAEAPPPIPFLIPDTLPERAVGLMVGMPGAGKTFMLCHMAICIAAGLPFSGNRPRRRGAVAIFHGEGSEGMDMRLHTAGRGMGVEGELPIYHRGVSGSIDDPAEWPKIVEEINAIRAEARLMWGVELEMVAIDTALTCFEVEDFSSAGAVGKVFGFMKQIRDQFKCCSMLVHHLGKDVSKGPLGSVAFTANPDVLFAVRCDNDENGIGRTNRRLAIEKQKDGSERDAGSFRLRFMEIGQDPDTGEVYGSMYTQFDQAEPNRLTGQNGQAFDLLAQLIRTKGHEVPGGGAGGEGESGNLYGPSVPESDWREAFYDTLRRESETAGREIPSKKAMQKSFKRARDRLADHGLVMVASERAYILRYM